MTPKERVLAALSKKKPDRTPVDFWAEPIVEDRLLADLGLENQDSLLDRLEVDIRPLVPVEPPFKTISPGIRENFWGERWKKMEILGNEEWIHIPGALSKAKAMQDLERFNWPTPDIIDYSVLKDQADKHPEHALKYGFSDIFERPSLVRGIENFLCDLTERPEMAHYLIEKFTVFYSEDLTRALEAAGGRIDIYLSLTDLGTQSGPLISLKMFDAFVKPYLKRLFSIAHQAGVKTLFHTCGASRFFIPGLIEAGMDILNPIQVRASGMVPRELKAEFGDKICFHGGVDIQETLPKGSPQEVQAEVKTRIEELGRNGGYILCPTHNLQNDTPTRNILAMYDPKIR